jgi:hypothetical protein
MLKPYIGYLNASYKSLEGWHYFESSVTPTPELYCYGAVIGPFRTKRAARWAVGNAGINPHFQTVADAERITKEVLL